MSSRDDKLSAFLDGELPEDEARDIEKALQADPQLLARLENLMAADAMAQSAFDAIAQEPVPIGLAAAIQKAPDPSTRDLAIDGSSLGPQVARPQRAFSRWALAASVALAVVVSGAGGYFIGSAPSDQQVASVPVWLADIADYHAIYASQQRHLVEVGADEADHIEQWLTGTLGAQVLIPDLSAHGLTFQGARLLVAAGKPVAQLMYTDEQGAVVALCQIQSSAPSDEFAQRTLGGFDMVSWGDTHSNFVIVADEGREGLDAVAQTAAQQV